MNKICKYFTIFLFVSLSAHSANDWNLNTYLAAAQSRPQLLIQKAPEILGVSLKEEQLFEMSNWQDRIALLLALSEFYSPDYKNPNKKEFQEKSKKLISHALLKDPALLVRDTAVESLRRILRMDPKQVKFWNSYLEEAFFDTQNIVEGSGLFIRETILTVMRESGMSPSRRILTAAKIDKNDRVKEMLNLWKTNTF